MYLWGWDEIKERKRGIVIGGREINECENIYGMSKCKEF